MGIVSLVWFSGICSSGGSGLGGGGEAGRASHAAGAWYEAGFTLGAEIEVDQTKTASRFMSEPEIER